MRFLLLAALLLPLPALALPLPEDLALGEFFGLLAAAGGDVLIAGVDEAGRGPLAGPVLAAAVILNPKYPIEGLKDSKLLSSGIASPCSTSDSMNNSIASCKYCFVSAIVLPHV